MWSSPLTALDGKYRCNIRSEPADHNRMIAARAIKMKHEIADLRRELHRLQIKLSAAADGLWRLRLCWLQLRLRNGYGRGNIASMAWNHAP
jgi:hypothetical protein